MANWILGVIGGSGLYEIDGVENGRWESVSSPWGQPSDQVYRGTLSGIEVVFLPRHGRGHSISPSHLNYRANIDILKRCGVTDILSLSAVGSLREDYKPGDFVMVDQFIDRTFAREKSFFGQGVVAHVSMAHPVCERLAHMAADAADALDVKVHRGGTYIVMEGPQFSSLAESKLYRQWGCDVIGMTNMPEAKLAREAEMSYATLAMVTDYDCWHEEEDNVSVTNVLEILKGNADLARMTVKNLIKMMAKIEREPTMQGIETGLDFALITPPAARDPEVLKKLDAVAGRVLK
ncbi:S-methyl-5'-thioadenosine phosphorylase [Hirschia baltica]|uniref:S-methyl-5'-thioadenosine phosphorylase n=1 Tax=Hirschia baltica (strain ATCC 49814 / DSM 5838 / IFAM 1418) TaxID=582402 RepID=C6XPF6_HIRBI|nr:methylthioadenosine phosphorylase [Hirschia baltica ATCC 49814]